MLWLRLIIIIALIVLLRYTLKKRILNKFKKKQLSSTAMVACAHCSLHIPKDEAIYANDQHYCCQEHVGQ